MSLIFHAVEPAIGAVTSGQVPLGAGDDPLGVGELGDGDGAGPGTGPVQP